MQRDSAAEPSRHPAEHERPGRAAVGRCEAVLGLACRPPHSGFRWDIYFICFTLVIWCCTYNFFCPM
jgi:hypothetical protein